MIRMLIVALLLAGPAGAGALGAPEPAGPARSWTLHVDNDLFAFTDHDRDYTGGIALTLSGRAATEHPLSLSAALDWINRQTRLNALVAEASVEERALELGLEVFTPHDLGAAQPLYEDRPYANLVYASSSALEHDAGRGVALQSSLTVGVLGLPFAESLHRLAHRAFGSDEPRGYAHQISDGGEPTFRYAVARTKLLAEGAYAGRPYWIRYGIDASVGYLTEASASIAFRWGRTPLPWWSSVPASSDYAGQPPVGAAVPERGVSGVDVMLDAGIRVGARLYNSFLQGQWRDSEVTFSSSELNRALLEIWLGVTTVFEHGPSVSYTIRRQTEEIQSGPGARSFTWAGIAVSQQF
jgi:hypothetical protein